MFNGKIVSMQAVILSLFIALILVGCAKDQPEAIKKIPAVKVLKSSPVKASKQIHKKNSKLKTEKKIIEDIATPSINLNYYDGIWMAQATSTPKSRKLYIKRVNDSIQGELITYLISQVTGNIYEEYSSKVMLYIKDGYSQGTISSLDYEEKVILYRDSKDSFRIIVDENDSKFFDSNEVRFIKYAQKPKENVQIQYKSKSGTLYDETNNIIWQDNRSTQILKASWKSAQQYCQLLRFKDHINWKLPTRDQLAATIDKEAKSIDPSFNYNKQKQYWSNSSSMDQYGKAWFVDYEKGYMRIDDKKQKKYIRCIKKLNKERKK